MIRPSGSRKLAWTVAVRSAAHSEICAEHALRLKVLPIAAALKTVTAAAMHTVMQLASEARLGAIRAQTTNKMGQKQMSTAAVGAAMRVKWGKAAS
jgi:hypothetical protein